VSRPPVRVTTDANGNKVGEQGHYPYGEEWYMTNTTTRYVFTNYHRDDESGNAPFASRMGLRDDYALHRPDVFRDTGRSVLSEPDRFHVNRLGRFSAVDPMPRRGTDPQSLNRYSYAHNNPIGREDPSGMLDNLVCGPLGDCGGAPRTIGGDFAGDIAAGRPSVDTGTSGPSDPGTFGHDTGDPSVPPGGICPDNEPGCGICDPIGCTCDPIFDPSYCDFWPKVGWAHYVELLAQLAACGSGIRHSKPTFINLCNTGDIAVEEWDCAPGCPIEVCKAEAADYCVECHRRGPSYYCQCASINSQGGSAYFCDCCRPG
jgi:RHS repeat-associated protein